MGIERLLLANGLFSISSGAVALVGALILDGTLGIAAWLLAGLGVGLILYGVGLRTAAQSGDATAAAGFATLMDALWVIGAVVILLGFPELMTGAGRATLAAVTVPVAGFALAQAAALRSVETAASA